MMNEHEKTGQARMPALFLGHGGPPFALEDNRFTRVWDQMAQDLPRPRAILSIAAHYETRGTFVTAMEKPRTIHDFGGFSPALQQIRYPAPGDPVLAREIANTVKMTRIGLDQDQWGLDHGTWVPLLRIFPAADIPVLQLSLDMQQPAPWHYQLGRELGFLRDRGVLVIANGGIVHNLRLADISRSEAGASWAETFMTRVRQLILARDHAALVNYQDLPDAALAVPTPEHYLPLLYVLGMQQAEDQASFPLDGLAYGSVAMTSLRIGC